MEKEKLQFFVKLIPPRPTYAFDLSEEEQSIMKEHSAYWKARQDEGFVIVYGPVLDPEGPYGIGILEVEDEQQLLEFERNDPALKAGNVYEHYPMKAIVKSTIH